ncbi:MAG TPA: GNAT family N-acetyltransferase [Candidatus Binatia bacterium]|nr:GNAT family N-acetyltransferase [Candidatus Binatia bacterium]
MAIVTAKYIPGWFDAVVSMLADAFVTNPLHVSAFGPQRIDQNRLFFRIGLQHMFTGHAFVALVDGKVQGYVHFFALPNCLPPPDQIHAVGGTLLKPLGDAVPRVVEWLCAWCRLDPKESHAHLGPIGVSPEAQGQGVGTALMNRYIEYLKQERTAGYLETDRPENVEFYKKFGFVVQREQELIGTPTWYMWRPRDEQAKS